MRKVIILITITMCVSKEQNTITHVYNNRCIANRQVLSIYRIAIGAFTANLINKAAVRGNHYMSISPHSVWITLAAIAEGTDRQTQKDLFRLLYLPENQCSRQKLYQIAVTRMPPSKYVNITEKLVLAIDQDTRLNPNWYDMVKYYSLLRIISAPIKQDPVKTIHILKFFLLSNNELNFNGNSLILNSMDYDGLWTTAFADGVVERSPFYSAARQQIGSVDLMKTKRIVRIGYVASMNAKVLELPIGANKEYRMIFALVVDNDPSLKTLASSFNNYTMFEMKESLQTSYTPVDVAIPRFLIKTEIDMKRLLEDMGVVNLWQDPGATWSISNPPALPTSYIQRTTLTLKNEGIHPPSLEHVASQRSNDSDQYWDEFVADRPFMVALVDAQTYTCLMVTMYSEPTYPF